MYRHVSTSHLDLGQLLRCPVSWCTVWKGTPQDCVDHVSGAHDVPSVIKSTNLDRFFPPWTVRHQIEAEALKPCHSGVSTDVLLFSEINLSLVHHYRVAPLRLPQGLPYPVVSLFRRRRPWLSVPCLLRFRSTLALRRTFAPVMRRQGLLERLDVSTAGSARLEFGMFTTVVYDCRTPVSIKLRYLRRPPG